MLTTIWSFLKQKNNLLITIVVVLILILFAIVYFQNKKIANLKDKYQSEVKLKNALVDSTHYYVNKNNELVAERLTLQGTIKNITDFNNKLDAAQKELMDRVKGIEKTNYTIAAALIQTNVIIDSLRKGKVSVDTRDSSITFSDSTKNIQYKIVVSNVKPSNMNVLPILNFNRFVLPNKQFIEFHWGTKKLGYPISFSVSNSNEYFKTYDINSYAIPELKKEVVDPSAWGKFTSWISGNGKFIVTIGIAGAAGAGAMWFLHK